MAQTRRKRQTKHRGNAAGMIESRGRTGRKPTAAEKRGTATSTSTRERLAERQERPPTWRGSFVRAMFAAVMMLAILLIFKLTSAAQALGLFPIVLAMYVPISYYTERWTYNRKQRSKARKGTKAASR
jgi:hypothetical protein